MQPEVSDVWSFKVKWPLFLAALALCTVYGGCWAKMHEDYKYVKVTDVEAGFTRIEEALAVRDAALALLASEIKKLQDAKEK